MKFISENQISEELVNSFDEEMTLELAKRLEEDNYNTPFDGLKAVSYTHLTLPTIVSV